MMKICLCTWQIKVQNFGVNTKKSADNVAQNKQNTSTKYKLGGGHNVEINHQVQKIQSGWKTWNTKKINVH